MDKVHNSLLRVEACVMDKVHNSILRVEACVMDKVHNSMYYLGDIDGISCKGCYIRRVAKL